MPTIKDVARLAGVSPSTVSNYFTGKAHVKHETRVRIAEAIRTLGYRPNLAARSLRLSQTQTIGLIVPDIANPFFAEIIQAIGYACQKIGYALLLADSSGDQHRETALLENMFRQHIDGLLLIHSGRHYGPPPPTEESPIPIVFVDREVDGHACVATDNYAGGRLAARHLAGLGHRRVGMLVGDPHVQNIQQRVKGFGDELKTHGISVSPDHVINGSQSFDSGRDARLLMALPDPPTAVFATNDIIALGAWHTLGQMGLRIPEDVSLMGYDSIDMTQWTMPPLSTVAQDKQELGRQSVATLVKAINSKENPPGTVHIPPALIVRGSTSSPQAAS